MPAGAGIGRWAVEAGRGGSPLPEPFPGDFGGVSGGWELTGEVLGACDPLTVPAKIPMARLRCPPGLLGTPGRRCNQCSVERIYNSRRRL